MGRVQLPTLSSTQNDWVVQQLIMNGKSTSKIALELFERYPDYAHDVREVLGEEDSRRLMGYRVKDIRKRESGRIDQGRAELAASRGMEVPAESVPTHPESDREWQLQNYRRALIANQQRLAKGSWSPGELEKLLKADDELKARIASLETEASPASSSESTGMVESWNVDWSPMNAAEELVYFRLTGSYGPRFTSMRIEIQRRLEAGEQVPTRPGLADDERQYKLPLGFDISEALSEENKRAYEDYVRKYNEETAREQHLVGDGNWKACEEPDYEEYAKQVEKCKSRYLGEEEGVLAESGGKKRVVREGSDLDAEKSRTEAEKKMYSIPRIDLSHNEAHDDEVQQSYVGGVLVTWYASQLRVGKHYMLGHIELSTEYASYYQMVVFDAGFSNYYLHPDALYPIDSLSELPQEPSEITGFIPKGYPGSIKDEVFIAQQRWQDNPIWQAGNKNIPSCPMYSTRTFHKGDIKRLVSRT